MKISQSLPRPENWQDFETLCKKLWGEIWDCPEIKKNGRSGQNQNGIDVYGVPKGENAYFGIQCKGKDEYTNKQLTQKEVDEEVDKALNFKPKLKKMYFATTAVKDVEIEEYVREKNLSNKDKGLFEVHLFSWEEIVELIQENKRTYDYYLNSNSFKTNQSVKVIFKNGSESISVEPIYLQKIRVSKTKREALEKQIQELPQNAWMKSMVEQQKIWSKFQQPTINIQPVRPSKEFNRSLFEATFCVENTGNEPIEDWKVFLHLPEQITGFEKENFTENNVSRILFRHNVLRDTFYLKENHIVELNPEKILVGDDSFCSDTFFLKASHSSKTIDIPWKLVSKNYKSEGVLTVKLKPKIENQTIRVPDDSPLLQDEEKRITIEDYLETVYDES